LAEELTKTEASAELPAQLQGVAASRLFRALVFVAAYLVPGAGHLLVRCYWRSLIFFSLLVGSFFFGLALHAKLFWPASLQIDFISLLGFLAQVGSGLCYLLTKAFGFGLDPQPASPTYEYGNTFTMLAGLLNYLVALDAFDIAAGRKR
jgi:hypothetical protein